MPGAGAAHLALPAGGGLNDVVGTELATAVAQNADAAARGFTLILKKNGRVGTRRLGMPSWDGLVQDVDARRAGGLARLDHARAAARPEHARAARAER